MRGHGEADLALGGVDVDVAEEADDYAGLDGDAVVGQFALEGTPDRRPAVGVENGPFGVGRRGAGVHQVDVEVALLEDLGDLPAHPARLTPAEGRLRDARDQFVELPHFEDRLVRARTSSAITMRG